ncbi:MAG: lipopolysaccharide core heptose(II) kinase RfaY, partial [Cetobacterium sp.]
KDDARSFVALIIVDGERVVYKVPKEKNTKKWQRLISIFRGSEAKREFKIGVKILDSGFNGAIPILAWEKLENFMAVDSFYLMSYIDSHSATLKETEMVLEELRKIHKLGRLHGDAHLANFMIKDEKVYIIDCKFNKNKLTKLKQLYEFVELDKSCDGKMNFQEKKKLGYKIVKKIDEWLDFYNYGRKKIKNKIK